MTDKKLLNAVLRLDLHAFIQKSFLTVSPAQRFHDNWHLEAIAWHLKQCMLGNTRRLIITLPPRNLKSISASVAFPAYILGHDPTRRLVCVSYSSELSSKHARDCRAIMEMPWYKDAFPKTRLSREKNAELDFMTTQRGYRLSTSVGGTLTGRGGNILIIDDAMKPEEAMSETRRKSVRDWFDNTLYSRLDDKKSDVIILIMQRLHIDDLVGHVLSKEEWVHLDLPAIAEHDEKILIGHNNFHHRKTGEVLHAEREPIEILNELKRSLGSYHFSAQYQQCPIPPDGELLKWSWFRTYNTEPGRNHGDQVIQSWDTASKAGELNSYSVCTTWLQTGEDYYLLDVFRERLNFPDLKRAVHRQAQRFLPDRVLIEDKASGTALIQEFRNQRYAEVRYPIAITPDADKITRASNISHIIEAGHVWLPHAADWLDDFKVEIQQFPNGRHDDQVDSVTQFLKWMHERKYNKIRFSRTTGMY